MCWKYEERLEDSILGTQLPQAYMIDPEGAEVKVLLGPTSAFELRFGGLFVRFHMARISRDGEPHGGYSTIFGPLCSIVVDFSRSSPDISEGDLEVAASKMKSAAKALRDLPGIKPPYVEAVVFISKSLKKFSDVA